MKNIFRKKSLLEKIEYRFLPPDYKELNNTHPALQIRKKGILGYAGWKDPQAFLKSCKIKNYNNDMLAYYWASGQSKSKDERDVLAVMLNTFCKIVRDFESAEHDIIEKGEVLEFYTIENI